MGSTGYYNPESRIDDELLTFLMAYMGGTPLDFLYQQEDPYEGLKKEDIIEVTDFVVLDAEEG